MFFSFQKLCFSTVYKKKKCQLTKISCGEFWPKARGALPVHPLKWFCARATSTGDVGMWTKPWLLRTLNSLEDTEV